MKTLSEIFKEIFALRDTAKRKERRPGNKVASDDESPPDNEANEREQQNEVTNPKNSEENERETNENRGGDNIDTPADPETGESDKGDSEPETPSQRPEAGGERPGRGGDSRDRSDSRGEGGERGDLPESDGIEEAYARGYKDGRNAVIEERYFPKKEDGIPVFHGKPEKRVLNPDIFSMAREA